MSWIILPKPGSQYGPCVEQCSHIDCDKTRQMSQAICPLCDKPCGYEKQLTEIGGKLAHNACAIDAANEEPDHDDTVYCCPDCERPNQFGEVCPPCQHDRQVEIAEREHGLFGDY